MSQTYFLPYIVSYCSFPSVFLCRFPRLIRTTGRASNGLKVKRLPTNGWMMISNIKLGFTIYEHYNYIRWNSGDECFTLIVNFPSSPPRLVQANNTLNRVCAKRPGQRSYVTCLQFTHPLQPSWSQVNHTAKKHTETFQDICIMELVFIESNLMGENCITGAK